MKAIRFPLLLLAGLAVLPLRADHGRPLILPFDLTLGGVRAQVEEGNQLFASIGEPVKSDAVLKVDFSKIFKFLKRRGDNF